MNLTPEERAALERLKRGPVVSSNTQRILNAALLRLCPELDRLYALEAAVLDLRAAWTDDRDTASSRVAAARDRIITLTEGKEPCNA